MKLADFDYEFPTDLIARYPAEPRDTSRLMVVDRATGSISHRQFGDIVEYFGPGHALVVNNTRVFPCRLIGTKEKTDDRVEVFLLRELNAESRLWDVLVNPARKIRVGNKVFFDNGLIAEIIDNTTSRGRTVRFIFEGTNEHLYALIDEVGQTPIPPYLKREADEADRHRYQTMFAAERGAVAAPTAGLHFTPAVTDAVTGLGTSIVPVTLHVGLGTFKPVDVEDVSKHRMDSEYFAISDETATTVNHVLSGSEGSVTVCGTTCVRALESSLNAVGQLKAGTGWTDKFIAPPYDFKITQRLITNFHMPRSTLLMLVSAFAGYELMRAAYDEAIRERYRLFSYGDCMLII
ncbi:MAG: tRNA preQ1(34) S-adenosylmethionine ribosyltransferase-isomerase QueA [Bacteroidetes bacterium]|nr:tRNA preQ1(34) S-adenosylmethionine ribosyltransferase-isomerase QueA [Bacteroidota bacterium]